jgi:hypothetical protein
MKKHVYYAITAVCALALVLVFSCLDEQLSTPKDNSSEDIALRTQTKAEMHSEYAGHLLDNHFDSIMLLMNDPDDMLDFIQEKMETYFSTTFSWDLKDSLLVSGELLIDLEWVSSFDKFEEEADGLFDSEEFDLMETWYDELSLYDTQDSGERADIVEWLEDEEDAIAEGGYSHEEELEDFISILLSSIIDLSNEANIRVIDMVLCLWKAEIADAEAFAGPCSSLGTPSQQAACAAGVSIYTFGECYAESE